MEPKIKTNVNQWVNPRNNHHVLIYKDEKGNLKEEVGNILDGCRA